MNTYSQRKSFAKTGAADLERTVKESKEAVAAQQEADRVEARAEYARKHAPVAFTPEQLKAATIVRTKLGWHNVVRVNAKSVTVSTGFSWNDSYTLDKILEVRTVR